MIDEIFFCSGCLSRKPESEISADPRYCQMCCQFLETEAIALPTNRRNADWVPVTIRNRQEPQVARNSDQYVTEGQEKIASAADNLGQKVERYLVAGEPVSSFMSQTNLCRGRPRKVTENDEVNRLHEQGLSSREIAARLGKKLSYRTVSRILSREQGRTA